MSRAEFLASLPRKRVTAGAVVRDEAGRVLLVEPTYRPDWLLPGGSVEADESPSGAARREVLEELGTALPVGRLLVLQWEREVDDPDGVLHFAYDGGVVEGTALHWIRLEAGLASFRFVPREAVRTLASIGTSALIEAAFAALAANAVLELEA